MIANKVLNSWMTEQCHGTIPRLHFCQPWPRDWTQSEFCTTSGSDW
jgi:hypothetical protein